MDIAILGQDDLKKKNTTLRVLKCAKPRGPLLSPNEMEFLALCLRFSLVLCYGII